MASWSLHRGLPCLACQGRINTSKFFSLPDIAQSLSSSPERKGERQRDMEDRAAGPASRIAQASRSAASDRDRVFAGNADGIRNLRFGGRRGATGKPGKPGKPTRRHCCNTRTRSPRLADDAAIGRGSGEAGVGFSQPLHCVQQQTLPLPRLSSALHLGLHAVSRSFPLAARRRRRLHFSSGWPVATKYPQLLRMHSFEAQRSCLRGSTPLSIPPFSPLL